MSKFVAIIPARYASTRFPGKPLALLGGVPIIQRVYERVAGVVSDVCVATDDARIEQAVQRFGGRVVMTSDQHRSGTDRCFEAYQKLGTDADVVINVQGDEPFIAPQQLQTIMRCFADSHTEIATLVKPFALGEPMQHISNPNSPKVVLDANGYALYFSRSVIPYLRGKDFETWSQHHTYLKHIGLYAYRTAVHTRSERVARAVALVAGRAAHQGGHHRPGNHRHRHPRRPAARRAVPGYTAGLT